MRTSCWLAALVDEVVAVGVAGAVGAVDMAQQSWPCPPFQCLPLPCSLFLTVYRYRTVYLP